MCDAINELTRSWAPGRVRLDGGSVQRMWWYRCGFKEVDQADGLELCLSCFLIVVKQMVVGAEILRSHGMVLAKTGCDGFEGVYEFWVFAYLCVLWCRVADLSTLVGS